MNDPAPDSLEAARAAVGAACEEAEALLARARALRDSSDALRLQFEREGVRWQGSPECYSFEKALRPLAERLYDLAGVLFRLCHDHHCTIFDSRDYTTKPVNAIGERALGVRRIILDAGYGAEPPPWQERIPAVHAADAAQGLPAELTDLPSLQWAQEQGSAVRTRSRRTRSLVAAGFVLLGAAGASVSGIRSPGEGGVGLLFALVLVASGGWLVGTLVAAVWRRVRRYRLMRKPSMQLLARYQRTPS